jgi:hypothetical protein
MNLIYIAGDDRSGSTMLDMMLSGHSEIVSIGESHQLKAYAKKDKSYYKSIHDMVCYCGMELDECSFWMNVQSQLGRSLDSLELKPYFNRHELKNYPIKNVSKKILWLIVNAVTPVYSNIIAHSMLGGERIGKDSCDLYEAVADVSGCKYVLDSSKDLHRMYSIAQIFKQKMKIILLCRDFKGTIYSKSKRGVSLTKAALQWKWIVNQMEYYSQKLNSNQFIRVKYEDICMNTEHEMKRICGFLELDYQESLIRKNTENLHHLGGSPSKYNRNLDTVQLDNSYVDYFTEQQKQFLYTIVKKQAEIWGYTKY